MTFAFKDIVRASNDIQAEHYSARTKMQSGNLRKLLNYLNQLVTFSDGIRLLDLGCGTGGLVSAIYQGYWPGSPSLNYQGVDLSHNMVKVARRTYPDFGEFCVGDAENLPFPDNQFDVAVSNSVLHWLNVPEIRMTPAAALQELCRVLKPDGWLAISVSGHGTARRFQQAFHSAIARWQNDPEFNATLLRKDPLGNMTLADLVDMTLSADLKILLGQLDYEPVFYEVTADYVTDVASYGYYPYMAAVPEAKRPQVWQAISETFYTLVGPENYYHDQYMNYLIARKSR